MDDLVIRTRVQRPNGTFSDRLMPSAFGCGEWAVTSDVASTDPEPDDRSWTVTHVPTGLSALVDAELTLDEARELCGRLGALSPLDMSLVSPNGEVLDPAWANTPSVRAAIGVTHAFVLGGSCFCLWCAPHVERARG
jgi:hypothetical protein